METGLGGTFVNLFSAVDARVSRQTLAGVVVNLIVARTMDTRIRETLVDIGVTMFAGPAGVAQTFVAID